MLGKKCPDNVNEEKKYSVDSNNPKVVSVNAYGSSTIIGNMPLPSNKVTSWNIKIMKSEDNDGACVLFGVAQSDINQNEYFNYNSYEWYINCYESALYSGPPHKYFNKKYGPRKEEGHYVHTRDSVGVVMDTTKGELSFVLSNVNLGVAYEGIPLDKPLVPCVILGYKDDSVELDTTEAKENIDSSIPFPSKIMVMSDTTWNGITLKWDAVKGALFYQFEVDGSKFWDATTTNTFTKRGFLPESEHSFRMRVAKDNSVGKWSVIIKLKQ